ncbi:MAG: tRNA pseudouridine(38-40) synthase TruA [Bdellovibrionales bacterium]
MKIRLLISYKGTRFFGWQKQKNQRTIQEELEKSIEEILKKPISLIGSGRTDTGVHALGQEAHFEIDEQDFKEIDWLPALNHLVPEDISVLGIWKAPAAFHSRFSAQKKTYQFYIFSSSTPPALFKDYVWWIKWPIDFKKLKKMALKFKGTQDFKSFQNSGSDVENTVKTIEASYWVKMSSNMYRYEVTGSGFLKQMVRNMVGTQIDLLKEPEPAPILGEILAGKDRKKALGKAPPQGLYLKEVFYPYALDRKCIRI